MLYTYKFFTKDGVVHPMPNVSRPPHRASAPGEAPASDTGNLVNQSSVELDGALASIVRFFAKYASWLEFGTSRMAARPFIIPAVERSRQWIIDRLTEAVRRGMEAK